MKNDSDSHAKLLKLLKEQPNPILPNIRYLHVSTNYVDANQLLESGGILLAIAKKDNDESGRVIWYCIGFLDEDQVPSQFKIR